MSFDAHVNFGYSLVATPPSPALSGGSLVLRAGDGALLPAVSFNMIVWPVEQLPLASNAEIVRVAVVNGDTLTILRAQEGSTAKAILAGYQVAVGITEKTITDIESAITAIIGEIGEPNGIAPLDGNGDLPLSAVPPSVVTGTLLNPMDYGATGSGQRHNDATVTGTHTVSSPLSATAWQASSPIGSRILICSALASGGDAWTTITGFDGVHTITVSATLNTGLTQATTIVWGTDDTTAITNMFTAFESLTNCSIKWPGLIFLYNGTGLASPNPSMDFTPGAMIALGPGVALVVSPTVNSALAPVKDVNILNPWTIGGYGLVYLSYTGGESSTSRKRIKGFYCENFSGAAVADLSNNCPYWKIDGVPRQSVVEQGIGVVMAGLVDQCEIDVDSINLIGTVKLGQGGNSGLIRGSAVYTVPGGAVTLSGAPRWHLWVVPQQGSATSSGAGLDVKLRMMDDGNGLQSTDYRIIGLEQNTGVGTDFSNYMPAYTTNSGSTNYLSGMRFHDSIVAGGGSFHNPVFYTSVLNTNLLGYVFEDCATEGTVPSYVIQFKQTPIPGATGIGNRVANWRPVDGTTGSAKPTFPASNDLGILVDDPHQIFTQTIKAYPGAADPSDYQQLLTTGIRSFTLGNATQTNITDDIGGTDASAITFTSTNGEALAQINTNPTPGVPMWVEFSLEQGAGTPMTAIAVQLLYSGPGTIHKQWWVTAIPASWGAGAPSSRYRFLVPALEAVASAIFLQFKAITGISLGTLNVGRVRVYHATEPINTDGHAAGNVISPGALATGVKAGAAADGDVQFPQDGMIRGDKTNNLTWVRLNGGWVPQGPSKRYYLNGGHPYRESMAREAIQLGTLAITTGVMQMAAIELYEGDIVTNLTFVAGTTSMVIGTNNDGHLWFALYTIAGVFLSQSADQGGAVTWGQKTTKTLALGTPQTISASGVYLAAVMIAIGTGGSPTLPTFYGAAPGSEMANVLLTGQTQLAATNGTGLTTTAPAGPITPVVAGNMLYAVAS